ncbi:MAG: hypothetical protein ABW089_14765 [Sedimenticola sp.]
MIGLKRILRGCLLLAAFFVSADVLANLTIWHTVDGTRYAPGPEMATAYCAPRSGFGYLPYPGEYWATGPNGTVYSHFVCSNDGVGGTWQNLLIEYEYCQGDQVPSADGTQCVDPVVCTEGQHTFHRIQSGNFDDFPASIDVGGCEYIAGHPDAPGEWECYLDPLGREWCTYPYGSTGQAASSLPPADETVPPPEEKTTTNEQPPTTVTDQAAPVQETDVPAPGDTTVTETTTETTSKPAYKDITNTETKTDIVEVSGENIVKTTTTTTTTKADGTTIVTETIEYEQDPVTVTKQEITWGDGTTTTTKEYPGASGSETTTTQTNPDGSSSTTVTVGGQGKDGKGDGTSTGEGPGDEPPEEEPEVFTGPLNDDAKSYGQSLSDFYGRVANSPIGQATDGIASGAPSGGTCSTLTLDLYFGTVSTTIHCDTWDAVKGVLSIVMTAAWSLLAVFILFSA